MVWAVPSCVSRLISIVRLNLVLIYDISPEFRGGVQLCIETAIRHRVSRMSGIRTDSVREKDRGHAPVIPSPHSVERTANSGGRATV